MGKNIVLVIDEVSACPANLADIAYIQEFGKSAGIHLVQASQRYEEVPKSGVKIINLKNCNQEDYLRFIGKSLPITHNKHAFRSVLEYEGELKEVKVFVKGLQADQLPEAVPELEAGKVPIGTDVSNGEDVYLDILFASPLSIQGGSGTGKTILITGIIQHLLQFKDEYTVIGFDPKGVELTRFKDDIVVVESERDMTALLKNMIRQIKARQ